jgi:Mor family transcriptional regulator
MNFQRTWARNRKIFAAHEDGESFEKLAKRYKLSRDTIQHIIAAERHRIDVSVDAFYKAIRSQKLPQQA